MRRRRWVKAFGLAGVVLVLAEFAVGRWARVRWVTVAVPVAEPVRIAVLGDFHLVDEASLRHARACLETAMAQQPDMILLVGDYVHTHHGLPYLRRALQGIRAPLGVYAVLGNEVLAP
jgi:predicted MPP superfamily phosphohydrolase